MRLFPGVGPLGDKLFWTAGRGCGACRTCTTDDLIESRGGGRYIYRYNCGLPKVSVVRERMVWPYSLLERRGRSPDQSADGHRDDVAPGPRHRRSANGHSGSDEPPGASLLSVLRAPLVSQCEFIGATEPWFDLKISQFTITQ